MTKSLFKQNFTIKESQCTIISDKEQAIQAAIESIKRNRQELEIYIRGNPKFLYTLKPIPPPEKPLVANLMAISAEKAGVGPMAAVAGAIADLAVNDMTKAGCEVAVVEDGGEISAQSIMSIDVAVAAGEEPLSRRFGFRLQTFQSASPQVQDDSATHLALVMRRQQLSSAKMPRLADAAATAVGNLVKGENAEAAIKAGICKGLSIEGVEGVLIIYKGQVGKRRQNPSK